MLVLITVVRRGSTGAATHTHSGSQAPVVQSGFYEIESFGGSSLSDDAAIYAGRIQGTGAVYAPPNPASTEPELVIRAQPVDNAPVVAYVDFWISDSGGDDGRGGLVFAADESGLIGELERVSQDDYGLVADRVRGRWIRVIYGYTPAGQARAGWVRLVTGRVAYISYEEQIRTKPVWFEDPAGVELFERPGGKLLPFRIPSHTTAAERTYCLEVLDIRQGWIQVRITVPARGACDAHADTPVKRSVVAWVRRLDSKGRFQIAYAAAGC
jgi:hypothetical protein